MKTDTERGRERNEDASVDAVVHLRQHVYSWIRVTGIHHSKLPFQWDSHWL